MLMMIDSCKPLDSHEARQLRPTFRVIRTRSWPRISYLSLDSIERI